MPYGIPLPNFLSNVLHPTGSTIDLLEADGDLFSNMVLPDGVDRDLVIETILEKYGMQSLMRPDPSYMKKHIGVWSRRHLLTWTKLYDTLNLKYNPIDNTDKYEDYTDTRTTSRTTAGTSALNAKDTTSLDTSGTDARTENEKTGTTRNESVKHDVSAENASDYQADARDTTSANINENSENSVEGTTSTKSSGTTSATSNGTTNETEDYTDTFNHTLHTHGNIGVTTTQQMIEAEREIVRYNLVEEIATDYQTAFCLDIY
mgnify:CR=1 FL=1